MMLGLGITLGAAAFRGAGGGSPPPAFDPASLFSAGEAGFVLDPTRDTLSTTTPGAGVSSITTFVRSVTFNRGGGGLTPTYQLDGSLPYLQFDGVDDYMLGSAASAGDAVTVVAAMRREQNAVVEDVLGITSNPTGNNGTFALAATADAASDNIGFNSKGTGANALARAGSSSVGVNYVVTGIGDISADTCLIRRNGVQLGTNANDQGTGDYNGGTVFLGSRGGTSRFFKGRLYAMIVIYRSLTAGELANAEAWAAGKCGITL
jgi:hypothetical protein